MNLQFNIPNDNTRRTHMSTNHLPPHPTSSYIYLRPHINKKPNLYHAGQRKNSHPYRKFQTGSTTTFSGYTNISKYNHNAITSTNNKNNNNNYHQHQPKPYYNNDNNNITHLKSSNNKKIPSLMSVDFFQQPPRKNRRKLQHAEQYKQQTVLHQHEIMKHHENNNNMNTNQHSTSTSTLKKLNGLILSDSMCKYVRPETVSSDNIQVKISFESGCDCSRMLTFLEEQNINRSSIFQADFVLFSLCTNDVANLGSDLAIKNCRILIERVRELFPHLKSIGWLTLSPRSKPSKLFNSITINEKYQEFNQYLKKLSKEKNFEIINANLQHQHMHYDGLHPSIQSGRVLIERALYNWFIKQSKHFSITSHHHHPTSIANHHQHKQTTTAAYHHHHNNNRQHHNHTATNHNHYNHATTTATNICHHHNSTTTNNNTNNRTINTNKNSYNKNNSNCLKKKDILKNENLNNLPSKSLISHYPHFLRHKDEFFRKITVPKELEDKKEDIFLLSNIHFQTEYFQLEAEKWKIYMTAAANKQTVEQIEPMETIIEDNDNELPIARPSPTGLARPPTTLDFSDYPEIFDEWLSEPIPGQKRKLGHRRDDPPTPPSPRQPPPIIPRKTLPPRNPNIPLARRSLCSSPLSDTINNHRQGQYSFNALLPLERSNIEEQQRQHIQTPIIVAPLVNVPSMIISPLQSSTPEVLIKSPSVIPKNNIISNKLYNFSIIPIECRYHFKRMRQKSTFETIKNHQVFLQSKYETLENEREKKLHSSFDKHMWSQVVNFVKNILEKTVENKRKTDKKRLDNLQLDQMREEARLKIEETASQSEQQYIKDLQEKYKRILDLKLQLDKLEKRFVENMPPPSLNIFDKIELHAKQLKSDNTELCSLREQWKNILRKTKLDLTILMRRAKVVEIEEAKTEYNKLLNKLADHFRQPHEVICDQKGRA
ncbi:unnamed protein product [Rotaria sordida]|uniref:Uncharacterized protein n=1 Tax=Rotaria sordida TaxID=392033 RepID=A0A816AGG1_9BILA|nr:unnamed protein product [Rotaria sordida]CAF1597161.1 unnamed protein product [Rotaria sordida]